MMKQGGQRPQLGACKGVGGEVRDAGHLQQGDEQGRLATAAAVWRAKEERFGMGAEVARGSCRYGTQDSLGSNQHCMVIPRHWPRPRAYVP